MFRSVVEQYRKSTQTRLTRPESGTAEICSGCIFNARAHPVLPDEPVEVHLDFSEEDGGFFGSFLGRIILRA